MVRSSERTIVLIAIETGNRARIAAGFTSKKIAPWHA
jgi:hypothetical protein